MRTSAEYRKEAEGYASQAEVAVNSDRRARMLEMAQSCLRLADYAELLEAEGGTNGHRPGLSHYTGL